MGIVLREAFTLACNAVHKISELYDLAGFYAWRALTDEKFMTVGPSRFSSRPMQEGARLYDWACRRAQNAAFEAFTEKGLTNDYMPKPDIKSELVGFGKTLLPYTARIPWGNPIVAGTLAVAFAVGAYAFTHGMGGAPHGVPEMLGTMYGSSPQGLVPRK